MEKRERERKRGKEERQTDKDRQAFTPSTQKVEAGRSSGQPDYIF